MTKGIWVIWNYRNLEANYPGFNEIYIGRAWFKNKPTLKEIADYRKKCNNNGIKMYWIVTCFADPNEKRTEYKIKEDIKRYSKVSDGICLDYIRHKTIKLPTLSNTKCIENMCAFAKQHTNILKIAVFPFISSFLYGQNYFRLFKYGILQPMMYPQDMLGITNEFSNKINLFLLKILKIMFPNSEPCLQGWNRKKSDLEKDIKLLKNNYSIYRYNEYNKLGD